MKAHQRPVGRLPERFGLQEEAGVPDRLGVLAVPLELHNEPVQYDEVALTESFAFRFDPFVVAARQEIADVDLDGGLQRVSFLRGHLFLFGAAGGLLEGPDVQRAGSVPVPRDGLAIGQNEPVRVLKGLAEVVQKLTEVCPGLWFRRVRPEAEREVLAGLRRPSVEHQVGHQRLESGRVYGGDRFLSTHKTKIPEEPDVEGGGHM